MSNAILLSGGIDSISLSYWMLPQLALTIDYGQVAAAAEIAASAAVCKHLNIEHQILKVNYSSVKAKSNSQVPGQEWWPYRNQLIITLAASLLMPIGIAELVIGTVASDIQYQDGSSEFLAAMNKVLQCQEGRLSLIAPASQFTSMELVKLSGIPLSVLAWAHSCNFGNLPCGVCRSCEKYIQVIEAASGVERPVTSSDILT